MRSSDEASFIIFSVFVAIIYGGWKLLKKLVRSWVDGLFTRKPKKGGGKRSGGKPFFVKSLTRRRRLDITRKHDNILSGKLGKKMDRHRKGMFGK